MRIPSRPILAACLLFLSGYCALIYQTVWLREFRLIFGASTAASAAVLGIFMGGLGLGSAWFAKRTDHLKNPLKRYGDLELIIGGAAAISPFILMLVREAYIATGGSGVLGRGGATIVRLLLATLVMIVPAFAMGGTLPAIARAVTSAADGGRRTLALLYGTNTMGAVVGTLLSTFVFVEHLGNRGTLWLACGLNVIVALVARALSRMPAWTNQTEPVSTQNESEDRKEASDIPNASPAFVLIASGVVGFAFMLMELIWYRMLSPILGGSTFTFGLILALALLGIGLGGALYATIQRKHPTVSGFAWTCGLEALFMAIPFALGDSLALLAHALQSSNLFGFPGQVASWAVITSITVLPAAIIAGFQFPMLISLLGSGSKNVARHTAHAYAANTAGAIVGSLAGGFGLMPLLGALGAWKAVIIILALLAGYSALRALQKGTWNFSPAVFVALAAIALLAFSGPTSGWRHSGIGAGRTGTLGNHKNELLNWLRTARHSIAWEAEGVESSVAVKASDAYSFVVNGKSDGNIRADAGTQVMGGLLPCLLRPAKRAMVVGLGTGSSAGWLGLVQEMEYVDVVELEPAIMEMARLCGPANGNVLENPKVHITFGDAREALLVSRKRYDLVFSEPSNPYRAGIASLFTREFYEAAQQRLSDEGIFAQWTQSYEIDGQALRTIYSTLRSVFPFVETWVTQKGDLLLLASRQAFSHDAAALRARIQMEPYRSALQHAWGVNTLEGVFAHYVGHSTLADLVHKAQLIPATDDRNGLEFGFARSLGHRGSIVDGLYSYAATTHTNRATIVGPMDWGQVDVERVIAGLYGHVNEIVRNQEPELLKRMMAVYAMQAGDPGGQGSWLKNEFEPRSLGELMLVSKTLARSSDPNAWRYLSQLAAYCPGDAHALFGTLFQRADAPELASNHYLKAFSMWQKDPWADPQVIQHTLNLAGHLGRQGGRQIGTEVFRMLATPFAVSLGRSDREMARLQLAESLLDDKALDREILELIQSFGENYPWEQKLLEFRMQALRRLDPPAAIDAALEVTAYRAAEMDKFYYGLPNPKELSMPGKPQ